MKIHHKEKLNRKEIIDMTEELFLEAEDIVEILHISRGKSLLLTSEKVRRQELILLMKSVIAVLSLIKTTMKMKNM